MVEPTNLKSRRASSRLIASDSAVFAGTWASNVGKWQIEYTEHEFCHLLEGRVVLTSADGRRWQFNAGDAWVIPAGFSGTWETVEPARKRYATFEAAKPA